MMYTAEIIVIDFIEKNGSDFIRYATDTDENRMASKPDKRAHRGKTPADIQAEHSTYGRITIDKDLLLDLFLLSPTAKPETRSIILSRAIALVYVIDANKQPAFHSTMTTITNIREICDVPILMIAVGLESATVSHDDIRQALKLPEPSLIRDCDIQNRDAVQDNLKDLLYRVLESV